MRTPVPKPSPPTSIDDYIANFPPEVQKVLQRVRLTIQKAAPTAEETISYQIPTFVLHGNLVHFAAWKKHIGFYPAPSGMKQFAEELSLYQGAKGSVKFPLEKPIPYGLIGKIVRFRVKENWAKANATTQGKRSRT